ncbi:MAG: twin-arginine translocase TatA/TatE family subunit [Thermodesulfobacteriota bacterium]|nr:twin-arginine translocase TatA/TatE family subunit [Thermodesulfobacteriota bacterium]
MFGMGMPEIILILAIALIVLGPKKLPEIAKALGRGISEFKRATQDFKESLDVDDDLKEARETIQEIKGDIEQTVKEPMTQGTASGNGTGVSTEDAVTEEDLEHSFEGDIKGPPEKPRQDTAPQEEAQEGPPKNV